MKQAFIAERDRQYKVILDIDTNIFYPTTLVVQEGFSERITSRLPMMTATSDVAKKRQMISRTFYKLNAVVTKLEKHDNSLFTDNGKLKTGLSCLHNFNA